jgi:hypothetical protein
MVTGDRSAAFYAPWARAWELAAGGMLACLRLHTLKPWLPWSPVLRSHVQSIVGVALITLGLILLDASKAFPGWWALLPVLGTVLCIAAGPVGWFNRVLLAWRPMVWVGLISYPLYLWHWPLLAFARLLTNAPEGPRNVRIGIVIATLMLAWLTYRFVEKRLRRDQGVRPIIILCVLMAVLGLAGVLAANGHWSPRLNISDSRLVSIVNAPHDVPNSDVKNLYKLNDQITIYRIGDGVHKVLLIGDSHVHQTIPRLEALVDHNPQLSVSFNFIVVGGCPPIMHTVSPEYPHCTGSHDAVLKAARDGEFDTVVFGGCWNCYFLPLHGEHGIPAYYVDGADRLAMGRAEGANAALRMLEQELAELTAKHKKVYLLLDNPTDKSFPPAHLLKGHRWGQISVDQSVSPVPWADEQARLHERMRQIALRAGAQVIDPIPTLCPDGQCIRLTIDGRPIYRDSDHLTASYAREYARYMDVLAQPPQ